MRILYFFFIILFIYSCKPKQVEQKEAHNKSIESSDSFFIVVLGVAQDGGYPQAGCKKECCKLFYDGKENKRYVSCLGIVDKKLGKSWMFDATPDFREQYKNLTYNNNVTLEGIFLTHAHIGHYTGIMQLGREVMGTDSVKVYVMPKMKSFLENNGPWSQLVTLKNISLQMLTNDSSITLNEKLSITPFLVPHRDEYSETVGYKIESKNKKILFIPDINKWNIWERNIIDEIKKVDIAFIDATFYKNGEIKRNMAEVPHPFIEESMQLFSGLDKNEKAKIYFIHFNHTNPVIRNTPEKNQVLSAGYNVAQELYIIGL